MIADLQRSHVALAAAQDEAVRHARLVAIGEMSAAVAHEIRNPLGALSNCVQMLRESPHRQADDAELLEIVHQETVRLGAIVSDFLAFGRPGTPHLAAVDVQELLEETANLLRRDEHRSAAVTIALRCPPAPLLVRGDRDQLRQVFFNLFMNACAAMGARGGTIEVLVHSLPGAVEITVSDTGPGIAPEALPRVFEPFFTTRSDGTGLGLAIVRRIIESHGGTIEAASPASRGAVFTCVVPAASPDDEPTAKSAKPAVVAHG